MGVYDSTGNVTNDPRGAAFAPKPAARARKPKKSARKASNKKKGKK